MQDILYMQSSSTSLTSQVLGMALFLGGKEVEVAADADRWAYQTVADAISDGWRVIKFPELALLVDEGRNYGMGCEFVLERVGAGEAVGGELEQATNLASR